VGDLGIDRWIMLKWILKKHGVKVDLDPVGWGWYMVADHCEHGNEVLSFQPRNFLMSWATLSLSRRILFVGVLFTTLFTRRNVLNDFLGLPFPVSYISVIKYLSIVHTLSLLVIVSGESSFCCLFCELTGR
jgi:hypothetical protein